MKVAIVGSEYLTAEDCIHRLPPKIMRQATEIVSGNMAGIDACAKNYAKARGLSFREFAPDYEKDGDNAPFQCNLRIMEYADRVLIFCDGKSRVTNHMIEHCDEEKIEVYVCRFPRQ